jgi:hypothetical protein
MNRPWPHWNPHIQGDTLAIVTPDSVLRVKFVARRAGREISDDLVTRGDEAAYRSMSEAQNPYGDGKAAGRIVARIQPWFAQQDQRSGSGSVGRSG